MQIDEVATEVRAIVHARVSDVPELETFDNSGSVRPFRVAITYVYRPIRTVDGWNEHRWIPVLVRVTGTRVSHPDREGDVQWNAYGRDLSLDDGMPEWVDQLIHTCRPSGELFVKSIR